MLKNFCLAALALTVAGLSTTVAAVTPPAGEAVKEAAALATTAEVKIELQRGDTLRMQGYWLPRDLKDGSMGPFQFATTRSIALVTACGPGASGKAKLRSEPTEVGTRLAIDPLSATDDGFIVRVKLNETKLKEIRQFKSKDCGVDLAETEGFGVDTVLDMQYGGTYEIPVKFGPQSGVLRLTVGKPIAVTQ